MIRCVFWFLMVRFVLAGGECMGSYTVCTACATGLCYVELVSVRLL